MKSLERISAAIVLSASLSLTCLIPAAAASTESLTDSEEQGIYQEAMDKIHANDTSEGIKLLEKIPDYKDSELYLQGYKAIEPLLGEWKGDMDKEFDQKGEKYVPTAFDIKFDDSNFLLEFRSSGDEKSYFNAYFNAEAKYSYMDSGREMTNTYTGIASAVFSTDGKIDNRGVAGVYENGFNFQLIYHDDGSCRIQFGYYDEDGELDMDTFSMFQGERVGNGTSSAESMTEAAKESVKESEETGRKSSDEHDFKSFDWGMSQDEIEAVEGTPDQKDEMSTVNARYIAYIDKSIVGKKAILAYYFTDDRLYEARYLLSEEHSLGSAYISDYEDIRDALTASMGEPTADFTNWDTDSHEDYYKGREGDALSYGYLSYTTWYAMDNKNVFMSMSADNYKITTMIQFDSKTIEPGDKDYSGSDW